MSEDLVSVVLNVPGGGATTTGTVVVVDDVVSEDVVCAKAAPVINSNAQALAARNFFIVTLHNCTKTD